MKARRRRQKRNGTGGAVVGGILGFLFPPLAVGSLFTGWRHPNFWSGATIGGAIGLVGTVALVVSGRASALLPSSAASPRVATVGDRVRVGQTFQVSGGGIFRATSENADGTLTAISAQDGGQRVIRREEVTRLLDLELSA